MNTVSARRAEGFPPSAVTYLSTCYRLVGCHASKMDKNFRPFTPFFRYSSLTFEHRAAPRPTYLRSTSSRISFKNSNRIGGQIGNFTLRVDSLYLMQPHVCTSSYRGIREVTLLWMGIWKLNSRAAFVPMTRIVTESTRRTHVSESHEVEYW